MITSPPPAAAPKRDPMRRRRERLGLFVLVIVACFAAGVIVLLRHRNRAIGLVQREDLARAGVVLLAGAESGYHEHAGRYGWVADLVRAGFLDGLDVVQTDEGSWVRTPGYRLDVLLPGADLGGGVIGIVAAGDEDGADAALQQKHFAIVARPLEPGRSGFRMWYLDERGSMFLNEGVVDDDSAKLNPLPKTQVSRSMPLDTAQMLLWQREDELRPDED